MVLLLRWGLNSEVVLILTLLENNNAVLAPGKWSLFCELHCKYKKHLQNHTPFVKFACSFFFFGGNCG